MILDPPHTSAPMLMRGNALVLKTPVGNAPRTSIEKHLSWCSDIPPAALFPLHRSRPAKYHPNRQPATVCAESGAGEARRRVGRQRGLLTSGVRQSLRALVMQSSAPDRGQHLTVPSRKILAAKTGRNWIGHGKQRILNHRIQTNTRYEKQLCGKSDSSRSGAVHKFANGSPRGLSSQRVEGTTTCVCRRDVRICSC